MANNSTDIADPMWTLMPITQITVSSFTILFNTPIFVLFLLQRIIITPFKVYIVNLVFVNLVFVALNAPMDTLNSLFETWIVSPGWCSLYIYTVYVLCGVQMHCHVLITINRLWAVISPVTYRHFHSVKMAVFSCFVSVAYVHVVCLSVFIPDELYYRLPPINRRCMLNASAQLGGATALEILCYDGPIGFMVVAFLYLAYKRQEKRQTRDAMWTRNGFSVPSGRVGTSTTERKDVEAEPETRGNKRSGESNKAFVLLAFLTLSVSICWTGAVSYYTALLVTIRRHMEVPPPDWEHFGFILFSLQPVVDPVLFFLTFHDIREAVELIFVSRSRLGTWRRPLG